ncbi:MAG TPA: hypothetical protein VK420_23120, partial [Longimicrobium sp.]|nr:hypothetical protein [Longimicrobium sp.]
MSQLPLFRSVVVALFGSTLLLGGCAPEGLGELDPTTEEVTSVDAEIRARPETRSLETSVNAAVTKHRGAAPEHGTFVDVKRMDRAGRTAFGSVAILAPVTHEEGEEQLPEGMLWAAVRSGPATWEVYLEHSPEFNGALETLSAEVMGKEEKAVLRKNDITTQGDASANLSLPWAPGQSWNL